VILVDVLRDVDLPVQSDDAGRRVERRDQAWHVGVTLHSAELPFGSHQRAHRPAQSHRAAAPALHVPADAAHGAVEVLDRVRRAQGPLQRPDDAEGDQGEGLVKALLDGRGGCGVRQCLAFCQSVSLKHAQTLGSACLRRRAEVERRLCETVITGDVPRFGSGALAFPVDHGQSNQETALPQLELSPSRTIR